MLDVPRSTKALGGMDANNEVGEDPDAFVKSFLLAIGWRRSIRYSWRRSPG
jgi:hypothetical protein